jgi:AcrR family transcriptional regulator
LGSQNQLTRLPAERWSPKKTGKSRGDSMTDKRDQIVKKAFLIFVERGLAGISLNQLIRELGITKSSFYYFFENKEDLVRSIVEKYIVAYEENKVKEIFGPELTTKERFRRMLLAILDYEKFLKFTLDKDIDIRNYLRFSMDDVTRSANIDVYAKYYLSRLELFKRSIESDQAKNILPSYLDSQQFAIHLLTCYEGIVMAWSMYSEINLVEYMDISIKHLFWDFHAEPILLP